MNKTQNSRRSVLKLGLMTTAGLTVGAPLLEAIAAKKVMPEGLSVYTMGGNVTVNGAPAKPNTVIDANAVVETAKGAHIVFVLGDDAFFMREKSIAKFGTSAELKSGVQVEKGSLLSSIARRSDDDKVTVQTSTAKVYVGKKSAALYVESKKKSSYICLCYGKAKLSANGAPDDLKRIKSLHHDKPRKVLAEAKKGKFIKHAKLKNHSDKEVGLLDSLNGRRPKFHNKKFKGVSNHDGKQY